MFESRLPKGEPAIAIPSLMDTAGNKPNIGDSSRSDRRFYIPVLTIPEIYVKIALQIAKAARNARNDLQPRSRRFPYLLRLRRLCAGA